VGGQDARQTAGGTPALLYAFNPAQWRLGSNQYRLLGVCFQSTGVPVLLLDKT
jgi:hypothetical protein